MSLTNIHTNILQRAFEKVLGNGTRGSVAFVRCLDPEVIRHLTSDGLFQPKGWNVHRVADSENEQIRTITADRAVEMREMKESAVLFLVDTTRCGAGMDGIYSAAREVCEAHLFRNAISLANRELRKNLSSDYQKFSKEAIKTARGYGNRHSISSWTELDYLCRIVSDSIHPGSYLYLLGLWPVRERDKSDISDDLKYSRMFVDRLLNSMVIKHSAERRIESLMLHSASTRQIHDLTKFLRSAGRKKLLPALSQLVDKKNLWVNNLKVEGGSIQEVHVQTWRRKNGGILKWSGLKENVDRNEPPELILDKGAEIKDNYVEIRWKAKPANLTNKSEEYRIAIVTAQDEELALREEMHLSRKTNQTCRFSSEDFLDLGDDAVISAKARVSVVGKEKIKSETEEFIIRFGDLETSNSNRRGGAEVRAFSEGLIELDSREIVSEICSDEERGKNFDSSKGYVSMHIRELGKRFKVLQPTLVNKTDKQWIDSNGAIGRWRVKVRDSETRTDSPDFIPFDSSGFFKDEPNWDRLNRACRQMANRVDKFGGSCAQIYDEKSKNFNIVNEYLLAWLNAFECGNPQLSLVNTIEVQSLSSRTIGLIVLPIHPLLVAWHTAYDNLVFYEAFKNGITPRKILNEFKGFDGEMFPSMLPGINAGTSFIFADTLGFHTVGMVLDCDREPKAAVSILHHALWGDDSTNSQPMVEEISASILGKEIGNYLNCHHQPPKFHIHALQAGDGMTMARSLGIVREELASKNSQDHFDNEQNKQSSYVLEFYPSSEQRRVAGRFITEAREKRRSGAGSLLPKDRWMLESLHLPGDISLPKLSWALKSDEIPSSSAHVSVAFDTFVSHVIANDNSSVQKVRPLHAFGLISFFQRKYTHTPEHRWQSFTSCASEGEKHPSNRIHSERLMSLQRNLQELVARNLDSDKKIPTLITKISSEREESLKKLHRLSDWVITVDRNAGIEYFDSPRDNPEIYDSYVINCIPEREDLGFLQMITSTGNLDQVRILLDNTLRQMGLSCSRRSAKFVLDELKSLSGRLAIQLTGHSIPSAELIALSASHARCREASENDECWVSLKNGFLVPVDDIRDLSPNFSSQRTETDYAANSHPDFIYVTAKKRTGLQFRFIEVKYRKHLRMAHAVDTRRKICAQLNSWHNTWFEFYGNEDIAHSFRALRRAKLARTLMFYAKKAYRHNLSEERYKAIVSEIDRMIKNGANYSLTKNSMGDRGWIFCPEFNLAKPDEIYSDDENTRIFIFGPIDLPDFDYPPESIELKTDSDQQILDSGRTRDSNGNQPLSEKELDSLNSVPTVCLGNDIYTNSDVRWSVPIKGNPHLLVAGLPGMGKTTCLLNLATQLKEYEINPIVFSFHEDLDEQLEKKFDLIRFIDFSGLGFNPLEVTNRNYQKAYLDTAGALRDIFAAIFPNLGDIQLAKIRNAIKASFEECGWKSPKVPLENLKEPPFKRFLDILRSESRPDAGLKKLLVRLDELDDYGFFDNIDTHENLWEEKNPIVIRIHRTQNDNVQRAFTTFMFYSLYKDMFRRGIQTRITHALMLDEAHRASKLNLIPTMAKECRKYGISLVLASQEAKDFHSAIYSAIANYLVLRLTEADAKSLVKNVASSHQERNLVDKVKQMDKFRALYFREGKRKPSFVSLRRP